MRLRKSRSFSRHAGGLAAIALLLVAVSVSVQSATPGECPNTGVRVFLTSSGGVVLNGRPVEVSQLKNALAALSPRPTVICYSRDNMQGEPPATMEVVLDVLIELKLPIGFYTDATFATPIKLK